MILFIYLFIYLIYYLIAIIMKSNFKNDSQEFLLVLQNHAIQLTLSNSAAGSGLEASAYNLSRKR